MSDNKVIKRKETSLTAAEVQQAALKGVEDRLYEGVLDVVGGTCAFAELDPSDLNTVPEEWIKDFGKIAAEKRHRIARAGWLTAKEAPIGISTATKVAIGIIRARAAEKAGPKNLNVTLVKMELPPKDYDIVDMKEDEG